MVFALPLFMLFSPSENYRFGMAFSGRETQKARAKKGKFGNHYITHQGLKTLKHNSYHESLISLNPKKLKVL